MPQIIATTVYQYDELPTEKAKQKALEWGYEIAADYGWWADIYEEAKELGCKISGFDTGRRRSIDFKLVDCADDIARKIMEEHGDECETYKTAKSFLSDREALVEKFSDGINKDVVAEDNEHDFDQELEDMEEEFRETLGKDYLQILTNQLEYLESEECILENFEANEYTFTEDGERFG